jgi:hypothetical protein
MDDNNDNPIIIRPHIAVMIGLSLSSVSKQNMWSYYDWVYCCFRSSVNRICSRIMIGLSSVSKHDMRSYDHILCLLTEDNDNKPIIIRPNIVFNNGRQRQPNYNATTYCVYWWKTTTGCCFLPSVNTMCGRIMIMLSLLSSVSEHNVLSYYDCVLVVFRQ